MLDARPNGWLARTVDNVSPLILLTAIGAVIVGLTLATPFAFERFGDNAFMALTIPAGLLTIAATAQAERTPTTRALWLILGVAIGLRAYVLLFDPLLSSDIYRYVWDGKVQATGINPYRYVPTDPALASTHTDDNTRLMPSGRTRTTFRAGLALMVIGSFVKGLIPWRCGVAGFFATTNFANPGSTNRPFFLSSRWPMSVSDSNTDLTCLRVVPSPTASVTACRRALLLRLFFPLLLGFAILESPRLSRPNHCGPAIELAHFTSRCRRNGAAKCVLDPRNVAFFAHHLSLPPEGPRDRRSMLPETRIAVPE